MSYTSHYGLYEQYTLMDEPEKFTNYDFIFIHTFFHENRNFSMFNFNFL